MRILDGLIRNFYFPKNERYKRSILLFNRPSSYQTHSKDSGLPVPTACLNEICEVVAVVSNKDQIPNPAILRIEVIRTSTKVANLPISKDFGLNSCVPILITPRLTELANYLPTKYLLTKYGWQLTSRSVKGGLIG